MNDTVLRGGVLFVVLCAACGGSSSPSKMQPSDDTQEDAGPRTGGSGGDGTGGGGTGGGGTGGETRSPDAAAVADAETTPDASEPDAAAMTPDVATSPDVGGASPPTLGDFPLAAVKAAKSVAFSKVNTQTEGPSFRDGSVFFASDSNGLVRADETGKLWKYLPTLNPVGSYLLADGSMLVCEKAYTIVQVWKDGRVGSLFSAADHTRVDFCNDLTIDAKGDIYFSNPHANDVWRLSVAGVLDKVESGMNFPNGVEVDPASKYLYVGVTGALVRIALPAVGNVFPAAENIGPDGSDGLAFDVWGNLWMALYATGDIGVFDPAQKKIVAMFSGGGSGLTNLTFAGTGTIYTTVANKGLYQTSIAGVRGFLHPGAAKYTIKQMLDLKPVNAPL